MKKFTLILAIGALGACNQQQAGAPAENATAETDVNAVTPASVTLNGTSWEFTREGVKYVETIDENGNYIADTADGKHSDHGTMVMKDGKACFTSKMNDEGEECWTVEETQVGQTITTTSDKGETLEVTRIEYRPLSMPS